MDAFGGSDEDSIELRKLLTEVVGSLAHYPRNRGLTDS